MSEANTQGRPWSSPVFLYVVAIAHMILGTIAFNGVSTLQLLRMPGPKPPKPAPALITPTPSGVTFAAPELPYTFILPNGFRPSLDASRDDARLLPEPWLPSSIDIELSRHELGDDVSTMDSAKLRQFAKRAIRGWSFGDPIESIKTADGSTGLMYPIDWNKGSLYTAVFHRRIAVLLYTNASHNSNEAQHKALREATRSLVSTMRFRD